MAGEVEAAPKVKVFCFFSSEKKIFLMSVWHFALGRPLPAAPDLGGIEQCVLHLGAALAARGHTLGAEPRRADIVVAINDARLLPDGPAPIVWFHNEVSAWREARRHRLPALFRHRPLAVFCGTAQARAASRLLPFRARKILPHGLPKSILDAPPAASPPPPHALFFSQAYRGLAGIIALWRRRIAPAHPAARLSAYIAAADVPPYRALAKGEPSIAILPRVANAAMPGLLAGTRLLLAPGHRAESFCLAAAEAIAMGVPVVTSGTGALKERVQHGRTGFICGSQAEMAQQCLALLTDDALWSRMQANGLATRTNAGWDRIARDWENLVAEPPD
jgi:hypothetical protein